ncbi:MAG: hypothetical protein HYZ29_17635 [Myxococcales bacterium]|nr:hypothetical protein [Myxococcales bacterium]
MDRLRGLEPWMVVLSAGCGSIDHGDCAGRVESVASELPGAYGIAVDNTDVYWTDNESGTVIAAPKSGGALRTLASGQHHPQFVALDSTHVYWGNAQSPDGFVGRVEKSGGPVEVVADNSARVIAVDASRVFFTAYGDGAAVRSAPLAGGPAVTLADAQPNPTGIAVFEGFVYWGNQGAHQVDGGIMKVPAIGGAPSVVVTGQVSGGVAADSSGIYWGNGMEEAPGVMRAPLAGGPAVRLAPDEVDFALTIDDDRVYFANLAGEVRSVPKTGGAACTIATGQAWARTLALDAEFIYWTIPHLAQTDGSVRRAPKRCCP